MGIPRIVTPLERKGLPMASFLRSLRRLGSPLSGARRIRGWPRRDRRVSLQVEALEGRLCLSGSTWFPGTTGVAAGRAAAEFDPTSGALTILGGATGVAAQVAVTGDGALAVTVDGQLLSSDPAAPSFDPAFAGAGAAT